MKGEVMMPFGELLKIIIVENLLPGARAVPEADLPDGVFIFKTVCEMGSKRRHPRTAANIDHLALRRLDMKVPERPDA